MKRLKQRLPLETITTLHHEGFILTYSDLDHYCHIWQGKKLVKNLIESYLVFEKDVNNEFLEGVLLNQIAICNKVNKKK